MEKYFKIYFIDDKGRQRVAILTTKKSHKKVQEKFGKCDEVTQQEAAVLKDVSVRKTKDIIALVFGLDRTRLEKALIRISFEKGENETIYKCPRVKNNIKGYDYYSIIFPNNRVSYIGWRAGSLIKNQEAIRRKDVKKI